jgi:hypothetical protein
MALQGFALELAAVVPTVAAAGLQNCTCTVQQRTNAVDPTTGQLDLSDWVDIPTLTGLPAMASIQRSYAPNQSATTKTPQQDQTETLIHVLLLGYYPGILQQYQLVVTGGSYAGTYEIMAVESDSQSIQTRLAVRVWTQ